MRFDKNKIIMIAVAVVLVIVLTVLVVIALGGLAERKNDRPQDTLPPTVQPQQGTDKIIETPYGNLEFPGTWAQYLQVDRIEAAELELRFSANFPSGKSQKLFDIRFGEALDTAVGQVVTDDGVAVGVHVTVHPFNPDGGWAAKESTAVSEMLESVTDVLKGLDMVPVGTPIPEVEGEEVVVNTPYGKLYFPGRWAEELKLTIDESDGYDLIFCAVIGDHDPVRLFAVNFGGSDAMGRAVGTVMTENDIPVMIRARIFDLELDGWKTVDRSTVMAMQEDLNALLVKLPQE